MYFEILFAISALTVFRIVYQIIRERRCVDDETLNNFRFGKLKQKNLTEHRRVVSHLGICDKCAERLQYLNFGKEIDDHFIEP
jgi:hypothetical protein